MLQKITKTWVNRECKNVSVGERRVAIRRIDRCTHFPHLVHKSRSGIIIDVVVPLFGGSINDYHPSDQSYRFVKRDQLDYVVAFEDWFEIDQSGDSYVDSLWYRHNHGLYRTCLGDLLGWMEGRGYAIGDNDDLLLR